MEADVLPESDFIEGPDGRLYELAEVPDYPRDSKGREVRCCVYRDAQRIEISEYVAASDAARLVARALGYPQTLKAWQLVPVVGRVV